MKFIKKEDNIIANEWKKRYEVLDKKKLIKIDEMKKNGFNKYQLKLVKRKRNEINEGDVFVLSPIEGIYFYGKVLKTNIKHIKGDTFISGKNVVFIFKCKTKDISIKDFKPDYNELLIRPAIVDRSYWSQGLFYTVGNVEITEEEKKLDYGFYSGAHGKFYKENGETLDKAPKYYGGYGITTIIGIAIDIQRELIINPDLLKF